MNYNIYGGITFILIFFIAVVFSLTINTNVVLGNEEPPYHPHLVPGDLVYFWEPTPVPIHMAIYGGKENGEDVFVGWCSIHGS